MKRNFVLCKEICQTQLNFLLANLIISVKGQVIDNKLLVLDQFLVICAKRCEKREATGIYA